MCPPTTVMEFKDYYATLGVGKHASEREIKQAYRKLARKHHPDVNPGDRSAEARFKEINEAYEVLGDPAKRKKYDELGANWRLYEQARRSGQDVSGGWPFGADTWTVDVGADGPGASGYRTMTEDEMREMFGREDPFSDFFRTFFGGSREERSSRTPRGRRGRDVEHNLELSLEEAFRGATRRVSVKAGGHARSIDVRIPAGVRDGARVRAAGEGEPGLSGAPAGDLFLRVHLQPHAVFERKGDDLHVRVQVPVTTAVLGGQAQVPTMAGGVTLKIPPMTQGGQVFRLKGHGMPIVGRPGAAGDLYATIDAHLPTRLTPEERAHYEALAKLAGSRATETTGRRR
jgi:DnaJ-class molecular chaperone